MGSIPHGPCKGRPDAKWGQGQVGANGAEGLVNRDAEALRSGARAPPFEGIESKRDGEPGRVSGGSDLRSFDAFGNSKPSRR